MPIKKENLELYPRDWRKISWWIINIRAKNRCEGIYENGEYCQAENHKLHPVTGKKVVLSVAHLDHNPKNSDQDLTPEQATDLSKSNMRAFCQLCHNRWDREHRNESIRNTYAEKHGIPMPPPVPEILKEAGFTEENLAMEAEIHDKVIDDAIMKMYKDELEKQTTDMIIEALQVLIARLPAQEATNHIILLKTLELQEEYLKLLNASTAEFSTPQLQAAITICRSKLSVIEQMRGLQKAKTMALDNLRGTTATIPDDDDIPEMPGTNMRGLGIRKLMKLRNDRGTSEI